MSKKSKPNDSDDASPSRETQEETRQNPKWLICLPFVNSEFHHFNQYNKSALGLCTDIFLWGSALTWLAVSFCSSFLPLVQKARQGFKMCSTPKECQWHGQMFSLSRWIDCILAMFVTEGQCLIAEKSLNRTYKLKKGKFIIYPNKLSALGLLLRLVQLWTMF